MVGPYRTLFRTPGVKNFVIAGLVGRMPMSMLGIGIVLLISTVTGSYSTAGAVTAVVSLAFAVATPISGRLADRFGQTKVLVPLALLHGAGLSGLILCAHAAAPTWTLFATGVATGATAPSLGSMVRARWSHVLGDPSLLHAAFSFESVADEMIFVGGPALVSALAAINVYAGLVATLILGVVGTLALAALRHTQPPAARHRAHSGSPITIPGVAVLATAFLALGGVFGSIDVINVAFARERGSTAAAGLLIACISGGSLVSGLWYGSRHWKIPLRSRFVRALALFAVGLTPVLLMNDIRTMSIALFFAGLAISPTLITGFSLVERLVPTTQLTEGMSWLNTSLGFGVAIGAWAGGRLTDLYGTANAYCFCFICALVAVASGVIGSPLVRLRETTG